MNPVHKLRSLRVSGLILMVLISTVMFRSLPRRATAHYAAQSESFRSSIRVVSSANAAKHSQKQELASVENGYVNLPLSFERNVGQTDPRVKFVSRSGNGTLWLTKYGAVLALGQPLRSIADNNQHSRGQQGQTTATVLRMKFSGANSNSAIAGEKRQPGTVNYFRGRPDAWLTKIPTYARVRYRGLYPGIDLVFHGNNRQIEYDLVVSPGADPRLIRLQVEGAEKARIDADGNLVLQTAVGDVVQKVPRIYQRIGGVLTRVSGEYVLTGKREIGFRLASYDRHAAVVIDPVLRYSTFLGGSSGDLGTAIAVDSSNRAVVAGQTCSPDFPATGKTKPSASCSAFVAKLDFSGSSLIFTTFLGETSEATGVVLDSAANVYVTGFTLSGNFPTTPGAFQTQFGGDFDAFVTKLNASGTALLYSTFLGGSGRDQGNGIAVDDHGNAFVTGVTGSREFPATAGAFQQDCQLDPVSNVCSSAFVTKLNSGGSQALYSTFLGGHGSQTGTGIAVDRDGHTFVTGFTNATDFPTTAGVEQTVNRGNEDAFITEVSSSGSHLIYSTFLGGTGAEFGRRIAVDSLGNAFVTGDTSSLDFPVKQPFEAQCPTPFGGCNAVFVSKLNPGGRLVYSTYLSGIGGELSGGIAVTPGGQAYVTGTALQGFPITQNAFQRVLGGARDAFVTKFSPTGKLIFSSFLGGNEEEDFPAVALDADTNAYITGEIIVEFGSSPVTFPVMPGALQRRFGGGGSDAFVAKVVPLCALNTMNRTVTICAPSSGSTAKSPVRVIAGSTDANPVKLTQVYLDGKKIFEARLSAINVSLSMPAGMHRLTVQAIDTANVIFKKSITLKVPNAM